MRRLTDTERIKLIQDPDAGIDWTAVVGPAISALGTVTALIIAVTR